MNNLLYKKRSKLFNIALIIMTLVIIITSIKSNYLQPTSMSVVLSVILSVLDLFLLVGLLIVLTMLEANDVNLRTYEREQEEERQTKLNSSITYKELKEELEQLKAEFENSKDVARYLHNTAHDKYYEDRMSSVAEKIAEEERNILNK